jgi:hypothetical protein
LFSEHEYKTAAKKLAQKMIDDIFIMIGIKNAPINRGILIFYV